MDNLDQADKPYKKANKDKNSWSTLLEKGEYFESQNNFDEANKYYEEMIRLFPLNYYGWFKRGLTRRKNDDNKGAIEDYTKSISLEPVYQAFANRAVAFLALNDKESALKDLNEALRLNPNDDIALRNRGQLKIVQGDFLESINDFDEAIKISPENPHSFHCRAFAKYKINDKKGAKEDWKKALDMGYEIASKALKDYFHE